MNSQGIQQNTSLPLSCCWYFIVFPSTSLGTDILKIQCSAEQGEALYWYFFLLSSDSHSTTVTRCNNKITECKWKWKWKVVSLQRESSDILPPVTVLHCRAVNREDGCNDTMLLVLPSATKPHCTVKRKKVNMESCQIVNRVQSLHSDCCHCTLSSE